MPTVRPLPARRLHAVHDPAALPWDDSRAIPLPRNDDAARRAFQPRVMRALDLALHIRGGAGYNVYLAGDAHLGRAHLLLGHLRPLARREPTPPDLVYLHNFEDQDAPRLLQLPAGQGRKLRDAMRDAMDAVGREFSRRLEMESFIRRRGRLMDDCQKARAALMAQMSAEAARRGFVCEMDDGGGLMLFPMRDGRRLADEELDAMEPALRDDLKRKGETAARAVSVFVRRLGRAEADFRKGERDLERETLGLVLDALLTPLRDRFLRSCPKSGLEAHFDALREDLLRNTECFLPQQQQAQAGASGPAPDHGPQQEPPFYRYEVNVLVDNGALRGAPVVVEDHPTQANLLGCIERESEMGALVTDFTLIRAGSMHRANGGYLVIRVDDLLQHPAAWEGLMRALRANVLRMEDGGDIPDGGIRTRGLSPEELPLNIKVALIGDDELYEHLLQNDERFGKLFRIKAQMDDVTERNAAGVRRYLGAVARIIHDDGLLPFDRSALAWLVDHGSHMCEDQRRLSLKFGRLREMMLEANALGEMDGAETVTGALLERAHADRVWRVNLMETIFMEEYDRELIKVRTTGSAVGQVNGLSVMNHGDFEFGLPHRIACSVGVGHEGIIDLEREAELAGPIHTKAMMILKSFLTSLFARRKPLVLSGSLHFEQSYAGIEGDSASGAELAALLSALAEAPVRLDLAFTGAVSHTGQIMAVGGVTAKIEGFFKVCARRGLTGDQGVIIPADNVDHLMLSPDVLQAVEEGRFAVYPVACIEDALRLLTGLPAGRRRRDDSFTPGSLYAMVNRRLELLGEYAQRDFGSRRRRGGGARKS